MKALYDEEKKNKTSKCLIMTNKTVKRSMNESAAVQVNDWARFQVAVKAALSCRITKVHKKCAC